MRKESPKAIGQRLKQRREELGLTQDEISERLDISLKHYSEIERGLTGVSLELLLDICEEMYMDMNYLVCGNEPPAKDVPVELVEIWNRCPHEKEQDVLRLMAYLMKMIQPPK